MNSSQITLNDKSFSPSYLKLYWNRKNSYPDFNALETVRSPWKSANRFDTVFVKLNP